jgi:hypothetical protein
MAGENSLASLGCADLSGDGEHGLELACTAKIEHNR